MAEGLWRAGINAPDAECTLAQRLAQTQVPVGHASLSTNDVWGEALFDAG